jgi:dipeptidyl aminopeptidase/acylaminoacyl peptidase
MKQILLFVCVFSSVVLQAQPSAKKPITHDVYDSWKRITGESISQNGQWIGYTLEPQEGDANLILFARTASEYDTIPRGTGARFTVNSDYCAFSIKPFFADIRKARIDKKKPADSPKDSLGIMRLSDRTIVKVPRVMSFKLPEKGSGWIAYLLEKEPAAADTAKKKDAKKTDAADAADEDKDKKDERGTTLVARELATGRDTTFKFVSEYIFTKDGSRLLFSSTGNDSTVKGGVFCFDTKHWALDTLLAGKGKYKQLAFDENGEQAAFVADRDTSKAKQRFYSLYYWSSPEKAASMIADTNTEGMRQHWLISENGKITFSKDGRRLFFGTAPVPMPEDTTLYESETAKLDVWNWQDPLLQSQQVKSLDEEKKRSYAAVIQLKQHRFVQLGDIDLPVVNLGSEGNADVALGLSSLAYRKLLSWDSDSFTDAFVVDVTTGARTQILKKVKGSPSISPGARYILWYDESKMNWFTYSVKTQKITNITGRFGVPLYNELNDLPDDPNAYGSYGWSEKDRSVLVYDRYDMWSVDPEDNEPPVNITRGLGRKDSIMFRYVRLDTDEKFVTPTQPLLLKGFRYTDKGAGYYTTTLAASTAPTRLFSAAAELSNPVKAKDTDDLFFVKNSFVDYPDLYLSTLEFTSPRKISDSNPQQKNYRWGTVELVNWIAGDGKPLDGLLYKPENFDPKKQYPMIVYFYERNSDLLHRYWPPAPSASTINASVYASNGYLVFIPDIRYEVGYPGKSALDAVVPGTLKLISLGFVDSARIAIQGQSWGGYQVAYIVTHSHMFRAAEAGAAVSNMTSAYGGIRWESGMSRMMQYERQQSRIGGTLWEKPLLYIENSPLFSAPNCTTPLMMMNNDADGAVPWYQGIEFFTALRRLGKPVWMLVYNNEAHNLMERKNRKDLSVRMMQFFDHYLKDAPMPVWMKTGIPAIEKGKTLGLGY